MTSDPATSDLVPLPSQPDGVPWPTEHWPESPSGAPPALRSLLDEMFDPEGPLASCFAVVVVRGGAVVAERYSGALEHWDRPREPVAATTPLLSWSMAKSLLHATVGMLVADGVLDPAGPAPVPEWESAGDPRGEILLEHLLCMRDGLDFTEDYVDAGRSDVIEMLFGAGKEDVAAFAAARPLRHHPGRVFNYSSGTSNVVSGVVRRALGDGRAYDRFLVDRLFSPLGMTTAKATFDAAGTWVASSYVHATARDYARFGLLYLRGGVWDGQMLLPPGWVDHGRRARSRDPDDERLYGAHWWVMGDGHGTFWANGYDGQQIVVCPALDLVVVRLGKTPAAAKHALLDWHRRVISTFADDGES